MNDLLPPNATAHERALSLATARIGSISVDGVLNQWNAWKCPAQCLPWLAWALDVSPWNPDWTEAQKRSAIANSVAIHRVRGTIGSLRRALLSLGYDVTITENAGGAFIFNIEVKRSTLTVDNSAILADVTAIALQTKNARSKLGSVTLTLDSTGAFYFAANVCVGIEASIWPDGYQVEPTFIAME